MGVSAGGTPGIDPQDSRETTAQGAYNQVSFAQMRVTETWLKYADVLTWGRGQCLAILDDGCDLSVPQWRVQMEWGPKVVATYNSIDSNDDPGPVPPGYHGTSVGYPSSINHEGVRGVAYNDSVAQVRCVSIVHLQGQGEAPTMAAALEWVAENAEEYSITTVNLSPLDDQRHQDPVDTEIDGPLGRLRELGIWVSAPCGNHHFTDGISWPACQPHCVAVGGAVPGHHEVHLDRFSNTDILVAAAATSSSNAYAAACSMILREALATTGYRWEDRGATPSEAILSIFRDTGVVVQDPQTGLEFRELDLLSAVDHVFGEGGVH